MKLLTLIILVLSLNVNAQKLINRGDLKGDWFASNLDSSFFKSDTVTLVKMTNRDNISYMKVRDRPYLEPESQLYNLGRLVEITFENWNRVIFVVLYGGLNSFWIGPMKWSLRADTIRISSEEFTWSFKVVSKGAVSFEHLISHTPTEKYVTLTTPTITLRRID